jgi:lysophospholipase L1-like esterase
MVAFLSELAVRAIFAIEIGPRILLYGTDWYRNAAPDSRERMRTAKGTDDYEKNLQDHNDAEARSDSVEKHENVRGAYTKFFPNEGKTTRDVDTGERISVAINSHGFRGPEFSIPKPPGVIRVLTLGASSTFGFYNRDDETYPHLLAKRLNENAVGGQRFEVINFGIPHATSASIAAMFLAEGLELDPDIVTFYEGRNDSTLRHEPDGFFEKSWSVLVHRSLLAAFIDQAVVGERESPTDASYKFERFAEIRGHFFLDNLDRLRKACTSRGITLIVSNQQATSYSPFPRAEPQRLPLRGISFSEEVKRIKDRVDTADQVTFLEYTLLVHEHLMSLLRDWARKNSVVFVDVIGALDQDRHYLLSWVHLHPKANQILADRLADAILAVVKDR